MKNISLTGAWKYIIDERNEGIQKAYYNNNFEPNEFTMPGTTNSNGIGTKLDESILDSKESVKCLREKYNYLGVMWYQKEVIIQKEFLNQEVELFFERVMFESTVYINGNLVGKNSSLSTPHRYLVGTYLTEGNNTITVRIDNNDVEGIGVYASAMTVDTSTVWNGIIGELSLIKKPLVDITNIKIFPNMEESKIVIKFKGINYKNENTEVGLKFQAECSSLVHKPTSHNINVEHNKLYEIEYNMKDFLKWDEFTPVVYTLNINSDYFKKKKTFGMREIKTNKQQILVNGRPTFFLGTLECSIFPLTGYPPVDREYWEKNIQCSNRIWFKSHKISFMDTTRNGIYCSG